MNGAFYNRVSLVRELEYLSWKTAVRRFLVPLDVYLFS